MILEYIVDILTFEFRADIILKKSYLLKVVIDNWIIRLVVLLLNGKKVIVNRNLNMLRIHCGY